MSDINQQAVDKRLEDIYNGLRMLKVGDVIITDKQEKISREIKEITGILSDIRKELRRDRHKKLKKAYKKYLKDKNT